MRGMDGSTVCLCIVIVVIIHGEEELSTAASLQESETESPMKRYCTERSLSLFVVSKLKHLICRAAARLGSRALGAERVSSGHPDVIPPNGYMHDGIVAFVLFGARINMSTAATRKREREPCFNWTKLVLA